MGRTRSGHSLVSLQLALCVPLLVGAGLLARTLYNLQHMDLGYRAGPLLLVGITITSPRWSRWKATCPRKAVTTHL